MPSAHVRQKNLSTKIYPLVDSFVGLSSNKKKNILWCVNKVTLCGSIYVWFIENLCAWNDIKLSWLIRMGKSREREKKTIKKFN